MPSKITNPKSPVGNFGFNLKNPAGAVGTLIQYALGLTFLIVVAGFAWNTGAPTVSGLVSSASGGRINPGTPGGSTDSASIEVV